MKEMTYCVLIRNMNSLQQSFASYVTYSSIVYIVQPEKQTKLVCPYI